MINAKTVRDLVCLIILLQCIFFFSLSLSLSILKQKKLCREKQSSIKFFFFFLNCRTRNNNNNKTIKRELEKTIHWRGYFHCLWYNFICSLSVHLYAHSLIQIYTCIKQNCCTHAWTFKCIYSWSGRKAIILRDGWRIKINSIINR